MTAIDSDSLKPIPQSLVETANKFNDKIAHRIYDDGTWHTTDWAQMLMDVDQAARALLSFGLKKGDIVCIIGGNRPEWRVMAHAAMAIGCPPAGIYFSCSADEIKYIANHSKSKIILCDTDEHLKDVAAIRKSTKIKHVVSMDTISMSKDVLSWPAFMHKGAQKFQAEVNKRRDALNMTDTSVLVYTSGTVGPPKAVVLSHRVTAWVPETLRAMFNVDENERLISYLPLAHIAEFTNTVLMPAISANEIWFVRDMLTVSDRLPECKPTIFFAVPRVWQKIEEKITQKLAVATGAKAKLARWAIKVGEDHARLRLNGDSIPAGLRVKHKIADRLILTKVRDALGLNDCKVAISGAAPISLATLEFIAGLGVTIYEVYGQSEDGGPTTMNTYENLKLGTVGKPLPGLEIKIATDDEVLVRGPSLFDGYLNDPKTTKETLIDGWMHTGDLGRIDNEGFLSIIGRKKDIMITAGGKNIAPANIESEMMDIPLVEHAMLIGEGQKFLSALITISEDVLASFAEQNGLTDPTPNDPQLFEAVNVEIERINKRYARVEQVRKFAILNRPLDQAKGELTPTMKMKRNIIMENHKVVIDQLYTD